MKKQTMFGGLALAGALVVGGVLGAQMPKDNINPGHHPNLAAAQRLSQQAWEKVTAAQQANEWDMDGHAAKAKDLLDQANREIKMAAEAANHHR